MAIYMCIYILIEGCFAVKNNFLFCSMCSLSTALALTLSQEVLASSVLDVSSSAFEEERQVKTDFTVKSFFAHGTVEPQGNHDALMQVVAGKKVQSSNKEQAKDHFYKAARLKDPRGMIELAYVYYDEKSLAEAMRWATLAYHTHHSGTGNPYDYATTFFKKVRDDLEPEKKNKYKSRDKFDDKKTLKLAIREFLASPYFEDRMHTSKIVWALTLEPFYERALAKSKRIFLLGLTQNPPVETIARFISSRHASDLEKLMTLSREVALSKGETEQQGLLFLSRVLERQSDSRVFKVFERINTPESLERCGQILVKQALSEDTKNPVRNLLLQKAIKFFERSASPASYNLIGDLYMHYMFEDKERYQKAFKSYERSTLVDSLLNIAEIIRYGHHGEQPDPEKAREMLLSLKEQLEKDPSSKESNTVLPYVYNNLGSIAQALGDIETASEFYLKSGTDLALNSLAIILQRSGEGEEALRIYQGIGSIEERLNINYSLYDKQELSAEEYFDILGKMLAENPTPVEAGYILVQMTFIKKTDNPLFQDALRDFNESSYKVPEIERLIIFSQLSFLNKDYDQARLYLSKLVLGASVAGIELLKQLDKLEEEAEARLLEEKSEVVSEPFFPEGLAPLFSLPDRKINFLKEDKTHTDFFDSERKDESPSIAEASTSSSTSLLPKLSKAEKKAIKEEKAAEKNLKAQARIQRKIEKKVANGDLELAPLEGRGNLKEITYVFSGDSDMEKAFNELQTSSLKFQELLSDIREQPWATTGSGKPEVLKGVYKGHKSCISRRLNHEDRFVYKVTGPGEILVLSVEGHYK